MNRISHLYVAALGGLEIHGGTWPPDGARPWRVVCPRVGATDLAVAELRWSQPDRCWTLRRTPSLGLPPCSRGWFDPGSDRPRQLPPWLEAAALGQAGAWAVQAACALRERESALLSLAVDLAAQVRVDRAIFVECASADIDHEQAEIAIADRYDALLCRADEALGSLAPGRAPAKGKEGSAR